MEKTLTIPVNVLWEVCEAQKKLIAEYKRIEGLPDYPLTLSVKKNQKLVRDFIGRFTEELSEAFEYSTLAYTAMAEGDKSKALEYTKKYNMEMGDAISFFVELMIYVSYDSHNFEMKLFSFLQHENMSQLYTLDRPWGSLRNYVSLINSQELSVFTNSFNNYPILSDEEDVYLAGGQTSWPLLEEQAKALWNVTHTMYKAANYLKHRDWSVGEKELNILGFQQEFFKAIMAFIYYLELSDHNETKFYLNYMLANKKNHERIKNQY